MKRLELSETLPSIHFLEKREARGVSWSDVRDILKNPSVVEVHNSKYRYVKGDLAIVVAFPQPYSKIRPGQIENPVLVTILLRVQEKWSDEDVRKL